MVDATVRIYQADDETTMACDHCYHILARGEKYAEFRNEFSAAVFLNFATYGQHIDFERERWATRDGNIIYLIR